MAVKYSDVLNDYYSDFKKFFTKKYAWVIILAFAAMPVLFSLSTRELDIPLSAVYFIPVCFAVVSMMAHGVSLPPVMYLMPLSVSDRKKYIDRMVVCKIAVPLLFTVVFDTLAAGFIRFTPQTAAIQFAAALCPAVNCALNNECYESNGKYVSALLYNEPMVMAGIYFGEKHSDNTAYTVVIFIMLMIWNVIAGTIVLIRWPKKREFCARFENTEIRGEEE